MIDDFDFELITLFKPFVYLFVIFLAIALHEMGHYFFARLFKMPIEEIVIGYGRTLKWWDDKFGTRWSIRLYPIRAYVHFKGLETTQSTGAFGRKPFYQQVLTILGGPLANLVFLPFLFFAFYCAFGQPAGPPVIAGIEKGLVADQEGLDVGDRFLAVDGMPLTNQYDIWRYAYSKGATEAIYTIERNGKVFDTPIHPTWIEYKDKRGVPRENARFGIAWRHGAYKLEAITHINGRKVEDNEELTRKLLIENFGKESILSIKSINDESRDTYVRLNADVNAGLLDPDDEYYEAVFLGESRGNIFQQRTVGDYAAHALLFTRDMIADVAKVPFQLFPIDRTAVRDEYAVRDSDTWWTNILYDLIHLFALASTVLALVNLLPLPGLDGGQILNLCLERASGGRITRKTKAKIYVAFFILLYGSILIANQDNFYGYIDSRLKTVHEFIDQEMFNISENKEDAVNG